MKKIIGLLTIVSVFALVLILSNGCSKKEIDNSIGTLVVKVNAENTEIDIRVYPYVADYEKLRPIVSKTVKSKNTSVSFDLNVGNYIVTCKGTFQGVQIRERKNTKIEF